MFFALWQAGRYPNYTSRGRGWASHSRLAEAGINAVGSSRRSTRIAGAREAATPAWTWNPRSDRAL